MMNIKELRDSGLIGYEYIRGSQAYGTAVETSDEDHGGVYICPQDTLMGLRMMYQEQIADEKSDVIFYELGRWVELLMKSNPTALEGLFIPEDCIIGEINPGIQHIINHRDMFLTKDCFNPLVGYSVQQIKRATGYNKKCNIPEDFQRKDILDFCYTYKGQGSQPIKEFLAEHKLDQRYCGLVNIPNMPDVYGVYYDFAAYWHFENIDGYARYNDYVEAGTIGYLNYLNIIDRINNKKFFKYSGIVYPEDIEKSNDVRLSSIPKGEEPICTMNYNKNAYEHHCREYKEWTEWKEKRNPVRFENNLGHNYDSKNMMHTMRLLRMGKELAQGKGLNIRRNDREYLLDIRNHVYSYEELMEQVKKEKAEFDAAVASSTLPDHLDADAVNQLLKEAREIIYKS